MSLVVILKRVKQSLRYSYPIGPVNTMSYTLFSKSYTITFRPCTSYNWERKGKKVIFCRIWSYNSFASSPQNVQPRSGIFASATSKCIYSSCSYLYNYISIYRKMLLYTWNSYHYLRYWVLDYMTVDNNTKHQPWLQMVKTRSMGLTT